MSISEGYLNRIEKILGPLALILILYHMVQIFFAIQGSTYHYITHLAATLIFILLLNMTDKEKARWTRLICIPIIIFTLVSSIYLYFFAYSLSIRFGFINTMDFAIGCLLVIAMLFTAWLTWGPVLPILTVIFITYFFLGHQIPPPLTHATYEPGYVMSYLCMGTNAGIFGYLLPISANFLFVLLTLGGIFIAAKVLPAFIEAGKALGNIARTGPAYGAVFASSMFGMISGAAAANVAFTGTFTIPTMKSCGYSPADAGAIESVASNGGQVTPPIMAATAFIMAAFLGVPYIDIALMAVLPAVIYYASVAFSVYLLARSKNILPPREPVNWHILVRRMPLFAIVVALLIVLLLQRYSVGFAAGISVITLVVLSLFQKETRPSFKDALDGCKRGVEIAASIAVLFGLIGLIAQSVITPGLGIKLSLFITGFTHGNLVVTLFLCMALCIILGAGMPTAPAYILAALTAVPVMLSLGVAKLPAHFFAFYFAVISALTPPVATASLTASRIANAPWMATSASAMRLAAVGWLLPFAFVMSPSILGFPHMTTQGVIVTLVMLMATAFLGVGLYRFLPGFGHLGWTESMVAFISFLFLAFYIIVIPSIAFVGAGTILFAGLVMWKRFHRGTVKKY